MRAAVTIPFFLVTMAIFSYVAFVGIDKRRAQFEQPATGAENGSTDPKPAMQDSAGQPGATVTVMTIEGQPFTWDAQSLTLSEQLQRQSSWLQSGADVAAVDEDLVTEYRQNGHGIPYPSRYNDALDERGLLFVQRADKNKSIVRRRDPNTGDMESVLLLQGVDMEQCLVIEPGIFCLVRQASSPDSITGNVVFVSDGGGRTMAPLTVTRIDPHLALLPDNSVLIVGGKDASSRQRVNTVERVRTNSTQLEVEQLPDIPGPVRWGHAIVAMQDGRIMVVGGNTAKYKGCQAPECSDKTHILNVETGLWTEGPVLSEPRASATASLLPDGSILVAGGWTSDRAGNARPSHSTERLWPGETQFVADAWLPFPMAEHRALDPIDDSSSPVLLLDDRGKSVIAYDFEQGEWRVVGGFSTFTVFQFGPFSDGQEHFFWVSDSNEEEWSRQTIRVRGYKPDTTRPHATTLHLYRAGTGILAGGNGTPAMIVGGHVSSPYRLTAAVDSYSDAEGLQALSPLKSSRYDAQVFRMRGGAIAVAGGVSLDRDTRTFGAKAPPIEFLREVSTSEKWQTLKSAHPRGTRYAQLGDDALVALSPGRAVERLSFESTSTEGPRVNREQMPRLPVHRESGTQPDDSIVARGLGDGRLIVAGGLTYEKRIAVYQDTMEADDEYVGFGNLVPANTYEVLDVASGQWATSAPSSERGGQVVLLDDGTVVKLQIKPAGLDENGESTFSFHFELSHVDEGKWSPLQMHEPPYMEAGSTQLLAVGNELFVAGFSSATVGMERKRILWLLDRNRQAWDVVWEERASSLDSRHQDVIARATLANGRELLVPVGGN